MKLLAQKNHAARLKAWGMAGRLTRLSMSGWNAFRGRPGGPAPPPTHGFTLLEVIFAFAIFFMVSFAILELTTNSLASARALQKREPDAGLIAAMISLTNQLVEGVESGDFQEIYPDIYPGWNWSSEVLEIGSNGLFQAEIIVHRDARKGPAMTRMSVLFYRPESPPGSASGGFGF